MIIDVISIDENTDNKSDWNERYMFKHILLFA